VIVGGGVAALETALALRQLAPEQTVTTVVAPNEDFFYRPLTVREPFAYASPRRYPLAQILSDVGAELLVDELAWVEPNEHTVHTRADTALEYDALVLALGARVVPRYEHAITIDDRRMDETLHGLIQDIEGGYVDSVAFVSPGRMPWQLPMYELALMTAGRAFDMGVELATTIVTPEDSPLAVFGPAASSAVAQRLERARIQTITSAYAEIPRAGEVVVNPGDHHLHVKRVVALPELYGPAVRGLPSAEHGFIRVDPYGRVRDIEGVYAAGDAIDFPIKHGGIGSQQADAVAESIAALAGAPVTPEPFNRRQAPVPDREDHRRPWVRLGGQRRADVAAAGQDRGEVPRAVPRSIRPGPGGGMSTRAAQPDDTRSAWCRSGSSTGRRMCS
jgi:sulfide:quinone oxidoreductase